MLLMFPLLAFGVRDCDRPQPDDLFAYKDSYTPVEYAPENFYLEVADAAILAVLLAFGIWASYTRRRPAYLTFTMVVALIWFGFFRGGCLCPVGATSNAFLGVVAPELVGKIVVVLFLLPLVVAFFAGRVFCSTACPIGAVQHLISRKKGYQLTERMNRVVRGMPVVFLIATIWGAMRGSFFLACRLDAYKLLFFTGNAWIDQSVRWAQGTLLESRIIVVGDIFSWLILFLTLMLGILVPRIFCRAVCPYSALLGTFSLLGLRRRQINSTDCINCGMCTRQCPVEAIDKVEERLVISNYHCIQCDRCSDVCNKNAVVDFMNGSK
jgi:polyferredoxin